MTQDQDLPFDAAFVRAAAAWLAHIGAPSDATAVLCLEPAIAIGVHVPSAGHRIGWLPAVPDTPECRALLEAGATWAGALLHDPDEGAALFRVAMVGVHDQEQTLRASATPDPLAAAPCALWLQATDGERRVLAASLRDPGMVH